MPTDDLRALRRDPQKAVGTYWLEKTLDRHVSGGMFQVIGVRNKVATLLPMFDDFFGFRPRTLDVAILLSGESLYGLFEPIYWVHTGVIVIQRSRMGRYGPRSDRRLRIVENLGHYGVYLRDAENGLGHLSHWIPFSRTYRVARRGEGVSRDEPDRYTGPLPEADRPSDQPVVPESLEPGPSVWDQIQDDENEPSPFFGAFGTDRKVEHE